VEAHSRRSLANAHSAKNPRLYLADTGVKNQVGRKASLVAGGGNERPRCATVVALAQMRTMEMEPVPLDEVRSFFLSMTAE
jgi:hypothetical protein